MSYARKGEGSDIYLMKSAGGWECSGCSLIRTRNFFATALADLIVHLKEHVEAGHVVPDHVFARLFCETFGIPFKTHIERALDEMKPKP